MREAGEELRLACCEMAESFGRTENLLRARRGPKTFNRRTSWPLIVDEGVGRRVAQVSPGPLACAGRFSVRKRHRSGRRGAARRRFGSLEEAWLFEDMSSGGHVVPPDVPISKG